MRISSKSKILLIVIIFAVATSIYNFNNLIYLSKELKLTDTELINIYGKINYYNYVEEYIKEVDEGMYQALGWNSDNYSTQICAILLRRGGKSTEFTIYSNFPVFYKVLNYCLRKSSSGIDYEANLCNDISIDKGFYKNRETRIRVTSGAKKGYNIIQFENVKNSEKAYVLVVVVD